MKLVVTGAAYIYGGRLCEVDRLSGDFVPLLFEIDPNLPDPALFTSCLRSMAEWVVESVGAESASFLKSMGKFGAVRHYSGGAVSVYGSGWVVSFSNDEIINKERTLLQEGKYAEALRLRDLTSITKFRYGVPVCLEMRTLPG